MDCDALGIWFEFQSAKSKKSLVFVELILEFPREDFEENESLPNVLVMLISSSNPWYGEILIYLHTLKCPQNFSREERRHIRYNAKNYLIINDTLYRRGVDLILRWFLTHEEVESVLNDAHDGACRGHLSGLSTTQKILSAGFFWPTIFKDCMNSVRKCHACQIFSKKMSAPHAPLFPVIISGPFTKWGVDFMTCNKTSTGGHHYIIVSVDYFTKWAEAMPTMRNDGETTAYFAFNQTISRFEILHELVIDHGLQFQNKMIKKLTPKLMDKLKLSTKSWKPFFKGLSILAKQADTLCFILLCRHTVQRLRLRWVFLCSR